MRFDRSASYRDSRRRTAAHLQRKRQQTRDFSELNDDHPEDDALGGPQRKVHFERCGSVRPPRIKFTMVSINESREYFPELSNSPYRRNSIISTAKERPNFGDVRSVCLEALTTLPVTRAKHNNTRTVIHNNNSYSRVIQSSVRGLPPSMKIMDPNQEAIEATAAADRHDRDPFADGLCMPETTNSREMRVFKRILRDPQLREPFQTFLEQQFCAENINFYVAVDQFRELVSNPSCSYQDREAFAIRIFDRHFAPNSGEPVNVDNSTSRRIKETMSERIYPRWTFDIAQYQIFHLLKYDCWPRFIRSGGVQPEFTDEELAEEDERIARLELLEDMPDLLTLRGPTDSGDRPCTSTTTSPTSPENKKLSEKRRSLLWQGFDRFSRRLRRDSPCTSPRSLGSSPLTSHRQTSQTKNQLTTGSSVQRTNSSRGGADIRSFSTEENNSCSYVRSGGGVVGSAGTRRRNMFASGKQYSMPIEMNSPNSRNGRSEIRFCRLMTGENCNTEEIELNDPTMSVRAWTQNMAGVLGMDKKSTEVVDAESGSTIDPARQAIDALQNRSVRIVPVVTFAVEILPPNYSFKNPTSTPTKIIMVRARHTISSGGVLRPLLAKYSIDYGAVVVSYCGTNEVIRNSLPIGNIGPRTLSVMTQAQFSDRTSRKDLPPSRDPIANSPNLADDHNLQFHQHGDVSYCELPSDSDRFRFQQKESSLTKFMKKASQVVTSTRSSDDPKKSSGRRKSGGHGTGVYCGEEPEAVSNKDAKKRLSLFKRKDKDSKDKDAVPSTSGAQNSACPSTPAMSHDSPRPQPRDACTTPYAKEKKLSLLRRDRHSEKKENLKGQQSSSSSAPPASAAPTVPSTSAATVPSSTASSTIPAVPSTAKPTEPTTSNSTAHVTSPNASNVDALGQQFADRASVTSKPSNGDTPRTPAIFSSKVNGDEQPSSSSDNGGWQPAAYV